MLQLGGKVLHSDNYGIQLQLLPGVRVWGYEAQKIVLAWIGGAGDAVDLVVTIQTTASDLNGLKDTFRLKPVQHKDFSEEYSEYHLGIVKYSRVINTHKGEENANPDELVLGLPSRTDDTHAIIGCVYGDVNYD